MEKTMKSLQVSRQHWINSPNFDNDIKEKINDIYFNENYRETKTPQEIFDIISNIFVKNCEICGAPLTIGNLKCKFKPKSRKYLENQPKEWYLHYKDWTNKIVKNTDFSFLTERNKSPEMRESSRLVGLKTGSKNIKVAHEKYDGLKYCDICKEETKHVIGIGCMPCWNKSDLMVKATKDRNIKNWEKKDYADKISLNLVPKFILEKYENPKLEIIWKDKEYIQFALKNNLPLPNFLPESIHPCGHNCKSVIKGSEYVCWKCYIEDFKSQIVQSNIEDFVKLPNERPSIVSEMNLGNIFLILENSKFSKFTYDYQENSLLYKGNLSIEELSNKFNIPYVHKNNFISESLQSCGHISKSVLSNGEYVCWTCYQNNFKSQMVQSEIEDFVKIPDAKPSIISEMNLGNIFLTLDNKQKPKLLSKNYLINSLLYIGNLNIKDLSLELNIPYGNKTTFMPEKLQDCGHTSKSVLSNGENYVCWKCYIEDFKSQIVQSEIEDFVKIPNEKPSIVYEMHLGNTFLTLDEEDNPLKLSKNYDINSLLYKGPLSIRELSTKLNIPYGPRTNFMPEKLQSCGHKCKSVRNGFEYVCWKCYVKEFENRLPSQALILDRRIPTFLNQTETNSIPGNRFEQYLVEQNIQWFTYIKFDINNKPLVVGKSGSLLVNSNGSDLSFDLNIDGGPARQLLLETNNNWNREIIEITPFDNEFDALKLELEIFNSMEIFYS